MALRMIYFVFLYNLFVSLFIPVSSSECERELEDQSSGTEGRVGVTGESLEQYISSYNRIRL